MESGAYPVPKSDATGRRESWRKEFAISICRARGQPSVAVFMQFAMMMVEVLFSGLAIWGGIWKSWGIVRMDDLSRMDRRQFAREIAAGTSALTVGLVAGSASAGEDKLPAKAADEKSDSKQANGGRDGDEPKPEPPPEVFLLSYLVRQFPNEHFDQASVAGIFRDIQGDVARGRMLREFPLTNADEPAFVFRAFADPTRP